MLLEFVFVSAFAFKFGSGFKPGNRGFVGEPGGGTSPVAGGRWELVSPVPARPASVPVAAGWALRDPPPEPSGPLRSGEPF
jgi:hypothetical protein